jgi:hypothetical protein
MTQEYQQTSVEQDQTRKAVHVRNDYCVDGADRMVIAPDARDALRASYSTLIEMVLGTTTCIFVTVNLSTAEMTRVFKAMNYAECGVGVKCRLGREYLDLRLGGTPAICAMETLWTKFMTRFNSGVLGTHRTKRCGHFLRWVRVYENSGKAYSRDRVFHMHMLLEVPAERSVEEFEHLFREHFARWIYPIRSNAENGPVLNIGLARFSGANTHSRYMQKQLIDWETASDRLFTSGIPRTTLLSGTGTRATNLVKPHLILMNG